MIIAQNKYVGMTTLVITLHWYTVVYSPENSLKMQQEDAAFSSKVLGNTVI